jgi:transcriptional regulator with XRE-family HTH domain
MSPVPKIAKVIRDQRKRLALTLRQLSELSGASVADLGRIEQGLRRPSMKTLQKIAKPLGFDLYELLVVTGHLKPGTHALSEEERDKLKAELRILLDRVASDGMRIREIVDRLELSG